MAKRILIIEDEISIAELEKDYLELSGFEVVMKHDGTEGLKEVLENEYNLVLLDIMLPGTDGFEILKKIREVKDTPVLMVTAKKEDIDKIRGLGLGADDYITKPFSPSELVARVKAHLSRYERLTGAETRNSEIVIRGLKIDKAARMGRRCREAVHDEGVRSADVSGGAPQPCVYQGRDIPGSMGYGLGRRYCDRNRTYQEDKRKDRI